MSTHTCTVKNPKFIDGHHPNSIRHLKPQVNWNIYIDETGNVYSKNDLATKEKPKDGKFVALVVPEEGELLNYELIPEKFHATQKEPSLEHLQLLDDIINEVLSKKVGVFGMSYKDSVNKQISWFNGICNFVEFILRLLPFQVATDNNVHFYIENWGTGDNRYDYQVDTTALSTFIADRLKSVSPTKYSNIKVHIQFVSKGYKTNNCHIYNAYVDTLAHSWGGEDAAQQRRKNAKFSGHCFLNIQDTHAIERLYAIIDDPTKQLNARDWYEMMLVIADEPEHSIMRDYLTTIAEKCTKDDKLWLSYLHEVQSRLRYKDYRSKQLVEILNWLDNAKPTKATLPPMLKLQFLSAKLASQNHTGKADTAQIQEIIQLGSTLIDEDAQQVAHAYIRVATAYANAFEFEQMKKVLSQEIMQNKLAIGLSNYAKALSSLGQYYCFTHQPEQAIEHFKQSIECFEKLSDTEQAQKDKFQTETYLMWAYLRSGKPVRKELQNLFKVTKSLAECVETYAKNENDEALDLKVSNKNYVFKHQVILRMLNQGHFNDLKESYLKHQEKWVTGKEHPWQSISFWRGMLLAEKGEKEQAQKQFNHIFNEIKMAEVEDVTLIWIYLVYSVAVRQLGFEFPDISEICYPMVKEKLNIEAYDKLAELRETKDINEIRQLVLQCLPFNYA